MDTLDRVYITGLATAARLMLSGILLPKSRASLPLHKTQVEHSTEHSIQQPIEQGVESSIVERHNLDPETMQYQVKEARNELWLLENHLKTSCKGCSTDTHCCFKHSTNVEALAIETQSMTTDPLWGKMAQIAREVRAKVHPRDVQTGKYASEYPSLVIKVAELRKTADDKLMEGHNE